MKNPTQYKNNFIKEKYDRINFTVPKGVKEKIKDKCDSDGVSVNHYIYSLILKDMPSLASREETAKHDMDIFLF